MSMNTEADTIKKGAALLRMAAYLLAVLLVFSAISVLCVTDTVVVPAAEPGVTDLTDFDFSSAVAIVATESTDSIFIYPGVFYSPKDFADGSITQEGVLYNREPNAQGEYGTLRMVLMLQQDEVYAIAGKNVSYAQRLFIDDKEYPSIGVPGNSIEAVTPKTTRFIEGFTPTGDTTEIIIHYSAFVYADGGGLYPFEIGFVRNVARNEQLKVFRITAVTAALITAVLFFFGLFLFFPKGRYLLWFALICLCVALRGLLTSDKFIMLLFPNLDWYLAIRLEFTANCGLALFSALYLNSLFPGVAHRWAMRGFAAFCVSHLLFIFLTPPVVFTHYTAWLVGGYAVFISCLLLAVLIAALRKNLTSPLSGAEQLLLLFGLVVYVTLSLLGIYAHRWSILLFGLDYPQVGMTIFLFINILTLTLGFARTEQELDEARRIERKMEETNLMLERLDRLRKNLLTNISHEMKTPLSSMKGYALLAAQDIDEGNVGADTRRNMRLIAREAQRLADLAAGLLRISAAADTEMAWERRALDLAAIFEQAADVCRPIAAKNNNSLETHIEDGLPPVRVSGDMIQQLLLNLTSNANRHTRNGTITFNAELKNDEIVVTVFDNGRGISPELLPRVFERRVSGDGGSGLGLAICKDIVEAHGGRVAIESAPGEGTRVAFTLPGEEGARDATDYTDD